MKFNYWYDSFLFKKLKKNYIKKINELNGKFSNAKFRYSFKICHVYSDNSMLQNHAHCIFAHETQRFHAYIRIIKKNLEYKYKN